MMSITRKMSLIKKLYTMIRKDIIIEFRRMYELISFLAFPIISVIIFTYMYQKPSPLISLAFLWIILILSTLFVTTTTFIREYDRKTLYGLQLLPISPSIIFISKSIYTFLILVIIGTLTGYFIHIMVGFLSVDITKLIFSFIIFSANLAVISSLVSALIMYSEGKIVLLPFIIMVYSFPIVLLIASYSIKIIYNIQEITELQMLLLHLIFFTTLSLLLIEYIVEE